MNHQYNTKITTYTTRLNMQFRQALSMDATLDI